MVEFYVRKYGEDGTFAFDDELNVNALRELQNNKPQKMKTGGSNHTLPIVPAKNLGLDSLMADLGNFSVVNEINFLIWWVGYTCA